MSPRYIDVSALFGKKLTAKIDALTLILHENNSQKDDPLGAPEGYWELNEPDPGQQPGAETPQQMCLHWPADRWNGIWNDYHFNIAWDPGAKKAYVVKTLPTTAKGQHLWGRNGGCYGIAICGMMDATPSDDLKHVHYAGQFPIQPEQIELAAQLIAELAAWKHINPAAKLKLYEKKPSGNVLVRTGRVIEVNRISDHADFARRDGYPRDRWDIAEYLGKVYDRANVIYRELKGIQKMPNGESRHFEFEEIIK